jgi:chromosome partitioning protein
MMPTIAVVNEKGGTGKTTTAVSLSAALAGKGQRVLLVDLDGQAAASRWMGVEEDHRLAAALVAGGGLEPVPTAVANLHLAPSSGKLDSVAHDLRPTQGGQFRRVLGQVAGRYDYIVIDCPPSLGNRLIGNAMLAATHALVPVETSILALDGLGIVLTTLNDIRDGFGHDIRLLGAVGCRYDARTRLSRLVMNEMRRALPRHVFATAIRSNVRLQECPATGSTIFEYDPRGTAAQDYAALAEEVMAGGPAATATEHEIDEGDYSALDAEEQRTLGAFRERAAGTFAKTAPKARDKAAAGPPPAPSPPEGLGEGRAAAGPAVDGRPHQPADCLDGDDAPQELAGAPSSAAPPRVRHPMRAAGMAVALVIVAVVGAFAVNQMRGGPSAAEALPMAAVIANSVPAVVRPAIDDAPALPESAWPEPAAEVAEALPLPPADLAHDIMDTMHDAPVYDPLAGLADDRDIAEPETGLDEEADGLSVDTGPEPEEPKAPVVLYPTARKFVLSGTMQNGAGGIAIINGQTVRVGSKIGGMRLVRVGRQRAELEAGGQSHTVTMSKPLEIGDQP